MSEQTPKILVVDDELEMRQMIVDYLSQFRGAHWPPR